VFVVTMVVAAVAVVGRQVICDVDDGDDSDDDIDDDDDDNDDDDDHGERVRVC
jgi:hypothetical protein